MNFGPKSRDADILNLLGQVKTQPSEALESETVEFKAFRDEGALHNSKDLAEEISAIANLMGGLIIVGVRDNSDVPHGDWPSQLTGIADVDVVTTKERLCGKLRPSFGLSVRSLSFEQRDYVVIAVPHPTDTLVSTTSGKTCIREGRSSRPMTPSEIEQAVKRLTTYDWSAEPRHVDPLGSLDPEALQQAMEDFRSRRGIQQPLAPPEYLEAVGATRDGILLTGGLLFLGRSEVIRSELGDHECRFSWKTRGGSLLVNDVWQGPIWSAVKRATTHFATCNQVREFEHQGHKFSAPLLDPIAFHEAYLNALVHRDYASEGMVAVNYTEDRVVVSSPGSFYGGVTADNIGRHEPRHRNKALARTLMAHHLVDRAGMGVTRMCIHSLMYGRSFPQFRDGGDCVEVSMQAEYLRPGITVLFIGSSNQLGIPELLILNNVYQSGHVAVEKLEDQLHRMVEEPWKEILGAIDRLAQVALAGTKAGVFVRVVPTWAPVLEVERLFPVPSTSENHVALYTYLRRHGEASNADLRGLLGHSYSSQTSRFLRDARYARREGSGPSARWSLVSRSSPAPS